MSNQSANARPCNCDQALKLERECRRLRGYERSFRRLDASLAAANATLARVREACNTIDGWAKGRKNGPVCAAFELSADEVHKALAAQPEAPITRMEWLDEAPAVKCTPPDVQGWIDRAMEAERDLAAANARADAAFDRGRSVGREDVGKYSNTIGRIESLLGLSGAIPLPDTVKAVETLAARADAAAQGWSECKESYESLKQSVHAVCDERDQLAARVKELESLSEALRHELSRDVERECTAAERKVLDAMARADITLDTHGHRRAIFDNSLHEILACEAELANRAAKERGER